VQAVPAAEGLSGVPWAAKGWGVHRDAVGVGACEHADMGDGGRIVLRLEVDGCGQEPVTGLVCVAGEQDREFSGWSELFAVLQTLLARSR
jgi:hypothetical protein